MSDQPRTIYRRPGRAGNAPTMQTIQRRDGTLNTRRLRNASPLQTVRPHSRHAIGWRGVLLFLLVVVALVLVALAAASTSRPSAVHGQEVEPLPTAVSSAPEEKCPAVGAMCARVFIPFAPNQ